MAISEASILAAVGLPDAHVPAFIDGAWRATSASTPVTNPAHRTQEIATIGLADPDLIQCAISAAAAAFDSWRMSSPKMRAQVLQGTAAILRSRVETLARLMTLEEGKTIGEARTEVARSADVLEYFAGRVFDPVGEVLPAPKSGQWVTAVRRPIGVAALLTPWNYPLAIPAWKSAGALAAGNTIVLKPGRIAPLSAAALVAAYAEAGAPNGVVNLVVAVPTAGESLLNDDRVKVVSFTGSTPIGRRVAEICAPRGAKFQCEMGGKNAAIVTAAADIDRAAHDIALGAMSATGQKCTSLSRVFVDHRVAKPFIERLEAAVSELVVGDGFDPATDVGPLVSEDAVSNVDLWVKRCEEAGGRAIRSASVDLGKLDDGNYYAPTLLFDVPDDHAVWSTELFAPAALVAEVADLHEAIARVNAAPYGLVASIYTDRWSEIAAACDNLDVGIVLANAVSGFDPQFPFGGVKASGMGGREQGRAAMDFFSELQVRNVTALRQ